MLTVLVTTHNRSQLLLRTLKEFTGLRPPASGWKLVVVDNGSNDETREVVLSFQHVFPVTYVLESVIGKNAALNTGLAELEGDLAIFTDDDVFPYQDWLLQLRAAADEHSTYDIFGGAIIPRWEVRPPEWLSYLPKAPLFSITDTAMQQGPTEPGNQFGPNLAIRSQIFTRGARFNNSIGPRGKDYAMGSETELLLRLGRQGHKAWHVRDAIVEHYIRKDQMEKSWVLKRAIRHGRGEYRLSELQQNQRLSLPLLAATLAPRMLRRVMRIAMAWTTGDERSLLTAQWELNTHRGQLIESYLMANEKRGLVSASLAEDQPRG